MTRLFALVFPLLVACGDSSPTPGTATKEAAAEESTQATAQVAVTEAFVRATPPDAPATAAFMTLTATGSPAALVAARTPAATKVELHTHTEVDGMMQMRPIERIDLPANEAVHLRPGGLHIMLLGPTQPLEEGSSVDLTLVFADGREQVVNAPVRPARGHHGKRHQAGHGECGGEGGCQGCAKAEGGEGGCQGCAKKTEGGEGACACGKAEGTCEGCQGGDGECAGGGPEGKSHKHKHKHGHAHEGHDHH